MGLHMLGRLQIDESSFGQRQAMLLLGFLALEGRKDRGYLAELFWPRAKNPLNNLSSAIARLRSVDPSLIDGDRFTVGTEIETDVEALRRHILRGEHRQMLDLYQGRFLDGFDLASLGEELEEWVLEQREGLATAARDAALDLAERRWAEQRLAEATELAEWAIKIGRDAIPTAEGLSRAHCLLRATGSPIVVDVEREASACDIDLTQPDRLHHADRPNRASIDQPTMDFVGREAELDRLQQEVGRRRPVAVVGMGGVGKTRLAREAVRRLETTFDQVHWVDAAGATSIAELFVAIGSTIAPDHGGAWDLHSIGAIIGKRRVLLLLDDIDGDAMDSNGFDSMVDNCPNLAVVLTGRSELAWDRCHQLRLDGLPVGTASLPGPAFNLFRYWADRRTPEAMMEVDSVATEIEICDLLGGLPLAVELAAGWRSVLTPDEILESLRDGSLPLDEGRPSHSDTRRSLTTVMDRTWQLLDDEERTAIDRLSIFPAGFDRVAAKTVGGCSIATLRRLNTWSLVGRPGADLYRCHPLIREYGRGRLAANPNLEEDTLMAHARHLASIGTADPSWVLTDSTKTFDTVGDPAANLMMAWTTATTAADPTLLNAMADPLSRLLGRLGRHESALALFEETASRLKARGEVDCGNNGGQRLDERLDMHRIWLHLMLGRYETAANLADALLDRPTCLEPDILVEVTRARATVDRYTGNTTTALCRLERLRVEAGNVSDRLGTLIDEDLGVCQMILGRYDEARASHEPVLAWARRENLAHLEARMLLSIGIGHLESGSPSPAHRLFLKAKAVAEDRDLDHLQPYIDSKLAKLHLETDNRVEAAAAVASARALLHLINEDWVRLDLDLTSALIHRADGDLDRARRRVEAAIEQASELGDIPYLWKSFLAVTDIELGQQPNKPDDGVHRLLRAIAAATDADFVDRRRAQDQLALLTVSDGKSANDARSEGQTIDRIGPFELVPLAEAVLHRARFRRKGSTTATG